MVTDLYGIDHTFKTSFVLKNRNQSTNVPLVFYTGIKLTGVWFLCFEELVYLTFICRFTLEASAEL